MQEAGLYVAQFSVLNAVWSLFEGKSEVLDLFPTSLPFPNLRTGVLFPELPKKSLRPLVATFASGRN